MIKKFTIETEDPDGQVKQKVNELIEQSNRQDEAIKSLAKGVGSSHQATYIHDILEGK